MPNILLIGCGARESAVLRNLKRNKENRVFCYLPHQHPEVLKYATGWRYFEKGKLDLKQCLKYCKENDITLVFIGSENYINGALSIYLESNIPDLKCICPSAITAQIETSKVFARNLIQRDKILYKYNPEFITVSKKSNFETVINFINRFDNNVVVKVDGLCSGKGVKVYGVHMHSLGEIIEYTHELLKTSEYVLIEERIISDNEFSLFSFTDTLTCQHTFPLKDFKRLESGNNGPNTGSMGCIYDNGTLSYLTPELINEAENINANVIELLNKIDCSYKGILYGSYIVTPKGELRIIEFNCRLGDPEGVMIMNRMKTDFGLVCKHIAEKTLDQIEIEYESNKESAYSICKYIVPHCYPIKKCDDFRIKLQKVKTSAMKNCFVGSVKRDYNGKKYATSSRTMVAYGSSNISLEDAEKKADVLLIKMYNNNISQNIPKLYYRKNLVLDYRNEMSFYKSDNFELDEDTCQIMTNPLNKDEVLVDLEIISDEENDSDSYSDIDEDVKNETERLINEVVDDFFHYEPLDLYKKSGVDIDEGNNAVKAIAPLLKYTHDSNVLGEVGGFGGLYDLGYVKSVCLNPVLVTSIDGVGTKSIFSVENFELDGYTMLGKDIVNHCVNDILVQGAVPLFFTDYFASSVLNSDELYYFIKGVSEACKSANCALIGGETAEMPNIYEKGMHDLVGNIVGVVDKQDIIDGKKNIKRGDVLVSLSSSGPHTNGFSLIRKLYQTHHSLFTSDMIKTLCTPHRSYLKEFQNLQNNDIDIHGMAHITGGGIMDNILRVIPEDMSVNLTTFEYTEIFQRLQQIGCISDDQMQKVFNCGIGMVFIVSETDANTMLEMYTDSQIIGVVS